MKKVILFIGCLFSSINFASSNIDFANQYFSSDAPHLNRDDRKALKIAKDWQLGEEVCQSLSTTSPPDSLLSKTLEDCDIASSSCLLFNQEVINEEDATHYLRQWQLPIQLLRQFAPRK